MTPVWDVIKAVYTALSEDEVLSGLVSGVFNTLAPETPKPYIVINRPSINTIDGFRSTSAYEGRLVIHGWGTDVAQALEVYNHIHRILHRNQLVMLDSEFVHQGGTCRLIDIVLDDDYSSYQAVVEYNWGAR